MKFKSDNLRTIEFGFLIDNSHLFYIPMIIICPIIVSIYVFFIINSFSEIIGSIGKIFFFWFVSVYFGAFIHEYGHYVSASYYNLDPLMILDFSFTQNSRVSPRNNDKPLKTKENINYIIMGPLNNFLIGISSTLIGLIIYKNTNFLFDNFLLVFGLVNIYQATINIFVISKGSDGYHLMKLR